MGNKFAVFSLGTLTAFLTAMPPNIKTSTFIVFFVVLLDTVLGVVTAIICKELKSSKMRTKLVAKTSQYAAIIGLTFCATIAFETWWFLNFGLTAVIATEVVSILESIVKLQDVGGVEMGPASRVVRIVALVFEATHESTNVITTATILPSHKGEQGDIITSTSVDNIARKPSATTPTKETP